MYEDQDLERTKHKMSDAAKSARILTYLTYLGYEPADELDAIRLIQENDISLEGYEMPENASTPEEWKQNVIAMNKRAEERNKKDIDIEHSIIWWGY